jgi:two-component system nitrogen regulation response regulator NtrX
LYFRLAVVAATIPPLRERREDIPHLIEHFLSRFCQRNTKYIESISREALEIMCRYPWPGNVRELKNLVERMLILSPGDKITREDVITATGGARPELSSALMAVETLREFRDLSERMFLLHKLEENNWNVTQTAQAIDTPRSNLYKKLEQYQIHRDSIPREELT